MTQVCEHTHHHNHHHHDHAAGEHTVSRENENRTLAVIIFTCVAMIAEIAYGYITHSMALLADGYHMGTHALALGLSYVAYVLARKFSDSDKFLHGTDKIGVLAAYTSAIFLGLTGAWIIGEAVGRLFKPEAIMFNEAILVAVIGLVVNGLCILVMEVKNSREKDFNFKAAYYHILADALTSILAIVALLVAKYFGYICLDSLIGILGGALILRWAFSLVKDTVKILVAMRE